MTAAVGLPTLRLIRWSIGSWSLNTLPVGKWCEIGVNAEHGQKVCLGQKSSHTSFRKQQTKTKCRTGALMRLSCIYDAYFSFLLLRAIQANTMTATSSPRTTMPSMRWFTVEIHLLIVSLSSE